MRCLCGAMMEVSADDDGRHSSCPVCRRRFAVRFSQDVATGQKGVSLQYLTDNRKSGETSTIGGGTTSFQMPVGDPSAATHGLLLEPELPDEAHFRCPCKTLLSIPESLFEKRSSWLQKASANPGGQSGLSQECMSSPASSRASSLSSLMRIS